MTDIKTLSSQNRAALMAKLNANSMNGSQPKTIRLEPLKTASLNANTSKNDLLKRFNEILSATKTTLINLDSIDNLPSAVRQWFDKKQTDQNPQEQSCLEQKQTSKNVYCGNNPLLFNLNWSSEKITISTDSFSADGNVSLSIATCAIADTGSLVLLSSAENPTSNNYLAEHHLVILNKDSIVPYSEDAWEFLQASYTMLPRAVNFISGPSSSADVGLTLEYGAHGPRSLTVFII